MKLILITLVAVVVGLMVACSSAPAPQASTPVPTTPSGAFSCKELADKLASAQTETAARILTLSWNESGCAQKVAGVTKVPTASPTISGTPWSESLFTKTPTPDIWVNARLKGRWKDLLASYAQTPEGKQHWECLVYAHSNYAGPNETKTLYHHATIFLQDYWSVEVTGPNCRGIQTWHIDDDTGAVTYEGSSLGILVRPTNTPDPWANANLKGRWSDMLWTYMETLERDTPESDCIRRLADGRGQATYYTNSTPDYWIVEISGYDCRAIETWKIYDDTGTVKYEGSSLDK